MPCHPLRRTFVAALFLTLSACADDETTTLFNEAGTWELVSYQLDAESSLRDIDDQNQGEAFLLKFRPDLGVVQTAACGVDEQDDPTNSTCRLTPSQTSWFCGCFAYAFEGSQMAWKEFTAGETPPVVDPPIPNMASADPETLTIELSGVMNVAFTYEFRPLPSGTFGSDGDRARFVFEQKAVRTFDQVFDDLEDRPVCEPCAMGF